MTHLPLAVPSTQDGISGMDCAVTRSRDFIRTTQLTRIRSLCIVPFKSVRGNYGLHRLESISWVVLFLFEFFWTVYTCNPDWLTRTHTHKHTHTHTRSGTLHREWTVPHPADSGTGGHSYKCWPSEHMASQHLACPTTQWAEPRYVQDGYCLTTYLTNPRSQDACCSEMCARCIFSHSRALHTAPLLGSVQECINCTLICDPLRLALV